MITLSPLAHAEQQDDVFIGCLNLAHGRAAPAAIVRECGAVSRMPSVAIQDRVQALIEKGRAEISLQLYGAAVVTAQLAQTLLAQSRSLAGALGTSDTRLLLADALRLQGDCKRATPEYHRVLDIDPDHRLAAIGLKECRALPPPRGRKIAQAATGRRVP